MFAPLQQLIRYQSQPLDSSLVVVIPFLQQDENRERPRRIDIRKLALLPSFPRVPHRVHQYQ